MKNVLIVIFLAILFLSGCSNRNTHTHEFQYICDRVEEGKWAVIEISCECGYHEMVDVEIHP